MFLRSFGLEFTVYFVLWIIRSNNNCVVASDYGFIVHKLQGLVFTVRKTYKYKQVV